MSVPLNRQEHHPPCHPFLLLHHQHPHFLPWSLQSGGKRNRTVKIWKLDSYYHIIIIIILRPRLVFHKGQIWTSFVSAIHKWSIREYNTFIYADDGKIFRWINKIQDCMHLQNDINSFIIWGVKNKLSINVNKCCKVIYTRKMIPYDYFYTMGDTLLKKECKYV